MYREGFLVMYESKEAILCYCTLSEGMLRIFSDKGGSLIRDIVLTGRVVKVHALKPTCGKLPHRFAVSRTVVLNEKGRLRLGQKIMTEFSAPTRDLLKDWANSIHLWRRMNWKENVTFSDNVEKMEQEQEKERLLIYIAAVKGPINAHSVLKVKKGSVFGTFLSRVAVSGRSPFSLRMKAKETIIVPPA